MTHVALTFRTSHLAVAVFLLLSVGTAAQQKVEKSNMDLVGFHDLQARSAY